FHEGDLNSLLENGYQKGVPMGGELDNNRAGEPLKLMIHAKKDPLWANLDRIQVVKGWIQDDTPMEKVYDVAWSEDRTPNASGKLPPVGNTVNLEEASFSNTIGAPELYTVWEDPDFDKNQAAFYYVRVLEIPSPTWILYDKVKNNLKDLPSEAPLVQQERAWSSPIWYNPED
ncbi:MAG: DUF3604 domain-containing protein, partial [Robiginitalea sp.]